ncbi:MAG: hypothetical protein KBD78_01000 [Oligoflexales bacterium]|nr:hypothetical protein [Oligoflexales bacterium]
MSKLTEISNSNEAAVVNRILRRVNRALDENFPTGDAVNTKRPVFGDTEVTAVTNSNKRAPDGVQLKMENFNSSNNSLPLPPPPPQHQNRTIPFQKNDNPENSAFAVSQHNKSLHDKKSKSVHAAPEHSFMQSQHSQATTDVSQFLGMGGFKDSQYKRRNKFAWLILFLGLAGAGYWLIKNWELALNIVMDHLK